MIVWRNEKVVLKVVLLRKKKAIIHNPDPTAFFTLCVDLWLFCTDRTKPWQQHKAHKDNSYI